MNFQNIYETQRQVYQGSSSSGTLLQSILTCYNGNLTNCNTTGVGLPILRRTQTIQFPSGLQSKQDSFFNNSGLQTETDDFDYGSGTPGLLLRKTLIAYASLGNGIVGEPASVTIQDGSGNTKAQTTYTYDGGSLATTSGTPNHIGITGSRCNPTTITTLVQGSTVLSKGIKYYDTGDLGFGDRRKQFHNGLCAWNKFLWQFISDKCNKPFFESFKVHELGLQWWRTEIQVTDENGQITTTTYSDPNFWRPASVKDPTRMRLPPIHIPIILSQLRVLSCLTQEIHLLIIS